MSKDQDKNKQAHEGGHHDKGPKDAHAQKILRQTGFSKVFPFAATVAAGSARVQPALHSGSQVDGR